MVHLPKNKERIEKFMQTGNTNFIYRNELDKVCFQHDMAYSKSKDFAKRTQSDKVLRDKAFKIASDPEYDGQSSVFCCSFGQLLKIPSKKISPIPMYTHF